MEPLFPAIKTDEYNAPSQSNPLQLLTGFQVQPLVGARVVLELKLKLLLLLYI